jgi:hypothetical protein
MSRGSGSPYVRKSSGFQWVPRKAINSPKAMYLGFSLIQALLSKVTLAAEFFANNISPDMVAEKLYHDPLDRVHRWIASGGNTFLFGALRKLWTPKHSFSW